MVQNAVKLYQAYRLWVVEASEQEVYEDFVINHGFSKEDAAAAVEEIKSEEFHESVVKAVNTLEGLELVKVSMQARMDTIEKSLAARNLKEMDHSDWRHTSTEELIGRKSELVNALAMFGHYCK